MAIVINRAQFPIRIKETGAIIPYDGRPYPLADNLVATYKEFIYVIGATPAPAVPPARTPAPVPAEAPNPVTPLPPPPVVLAPPEPVAIAAAENVDTINTEEKKTLPLAGKRISSQKCLKKKMRTTAATRKHTQWEINKRLKNKAQTAE